MGVVLHKADVVTIMGGGWLVEMNLWFDRHMDQKERKKNAHLARSGSTHVSS
jgi:hypothetical protein